MALRDILPLPVTMLSVLHLDILWELTIGGYVNPDLSTFWQYLLGILESLFDPFDNPFILKTLPFSSYLKTYVQSVHKHSESAECHCNTYPKDVFVTHDDLSRTSA